MQRDPELIEQVGRLPCCACPPPDSEALFHITAMGDASPRISDAHHVTTRGAGGGDLAENVMPLCRRHHTEWHAIGGRKMASKYPGVYSWLLCASRGDILGD